ncbi:MAG: SurA N-terminal domain-containing protein [Christensenella sp.]
MNKIKKVIMTAVCVILCVAFATSCSMVTVNEERDGAQVAAEVNGTKITKGEVLGQVDRALQMYGVTRDQFVKQYGAEQFNTMKEDTLNQMVQNELLAQHAKADGLLDESEENTAAKRKEVEDAIAGLKKNVEDTVNADDAITDKAAEIDKQFNEYIDMYGYGDVDKLVEDGIKADAVKAETDKLNGEVSYTEEDAKKEYDTFLAEQQPKIEEDAANYTTYKNAGTVVYEPMGSKYAKNLLIGFSQDVQKQIATLRQNGDDEGADKLVTEELAKIEADAKKALERAKAGEDFDALMEELGADSGMKQEPAKTKGYLVFKGSGMVEPFETAVLAMTKPGEISELVATDFGYHIIQYVSEGGGVVPFDDVKEKLMDTKLAELQSTHLKDTVEEWKGAEDVKLHTNVLSTFA